MIDCHDDLDEREPEDDGAIELDYENRRLRHELRLARARYKQAVAVLTGIHALMYPPPRTLSDGRRMVFRPKDIDPHEVLQELSDRIRAIPDELAKRAAKPEGV
jgi:hypothetical protein